MSLVNSTFDAPYNGVSQQDAINRLESQCQLQENAFGKIVDGLIKRPPTEFVKVLSATNIDDKTFMHHYKRDDAEQFIVGFTGDAVDPIEVYDLAGTKKTVNYEDNDARDYAVDADPVANFRAVTIADFTFLVNKTTTALMDVATSPAPAQPFALIWIKEGVRDTNYSIDLISLAPATDTVAFKPATNAAASSDLIATDLEGKINALVGAPYTAVVVAPDSSVIRVTRADNADFTVRVKDGRGNSAIVLAKERIKKFDDIPPQAVDGDIVEVIGDPDDSNFKGFYVKWIESEGLWRETIAPGVTFKFDAITLPHQLVRQPGGDFDFERVAWTDRVVGDDISAPIPSFIDTEINDVFFFKNRLGFIAKENVIMSRPTDFFEFWPTTATDVLDDDPIDIAVSSNRIAILNATLPFNDDLLLFSDFQQFSMGARDVLTPSSVSIDPTTSFEVDPLVKPVGAGPNAYFVSPQENFSAVREYFVQPDSLTNDAADVTAHVPRFLPRNLLSIESSATQELLLLQSKDDRTEVFGYKYFWAGNEKPQSQWMKWIFGYDVISNHFFDSTVFMIVKKGSEVSLESMELDTVNTTGLGFKIHLDRQVSGLVGVFAAGPNTTTWTLPYDDADTNFDVIREDNGMNISSVTKPTSTTLEVPGDKSALTVTAGKRYTERYRTTQWFMKDGDTGAILEGRLTYKRMEVRYRDTGFFTVEVTPVGRDTVIHKMTARRIGTTFINDPSIETGQEKFLITANTQGTTIDIVSDSYLPANILGYNFSGMFSPRSQAV